MKNRPKIALLLAVSACAFLLLSASASAHLRILSPSEASSSQPIPFSAAPAPDAKAVAFYVDGSRRWVDRSPSWKFGRDGRVDLRSGRHVLEVRAILPSRVARSRKEIVVSPTIGGETAVSASAPTEAAPASTEVAPAPPPPPGTAPEEGATPVEEATPPPSQPAPAAAVLASGFENGLSNWNTAGVGEVVPTIESSDARSGSHAARVLLTGSENRSELSLGGDGGEDNEAMVHFTEGEEYWYGFSFNIQQMVWGHPGAHNLIMQFKSEGEGSPEFGLQLWNYPGDSGHTGGKGLWSHSNPGPDAPGGDRFLAPISEGAWHDVAIHFKASSQGDGFYEIFLDGQLVESRSNVTMIVPGRSYAYIKDGIYRNGAAIPGTSEVLLDDASLGDSRASIAPR